MGKAGSGKMGKAGRLVDWGAAPFEGENGEWQDELAVKGLAHDGGRLWALDTKRKRICVLQKNVAAAAAAKNAQ